MTGSKPQNSPTAALALRIPSLIAAYRAEFRGRGAARSADAAPHAALTAPETAAVGAALLRLQRGLTGERALAGAYGEAAPYYMDDPELLCAYLLYYWPASYLQVSLALAELGRAPRRILDLGSGPGPAAAAAFDAAREGGDAARLVLVDRSRAALSLSRRMLESEALSRGASFDYRELDFEAPGGLGIGERFDLVAIGHCVNELWPDRADRAERRLALLESAAGLLDPGGALLVVEPALLATSRETLALRDALAARGYPLLGPCPGDYPCPALAAGADRTCHAETAWDPPGPVASLARAAGLDRRSVKSTWFAVGSPGTRAAPHGASAASPNVLLGRVVSDPLLNKAGRVRHLLCTGGRLAALSAARDSGAALRSGFFALRRGDVLRVENAEIRPGGGYGIADSTRLEIRSRAPGAGEGRA